MLRVNKTIPTIYATTDLGEDVTTDENGLLELSIHESNFFLTQGNYAGNGSVAPVPTWNGPASWPHPRNILRLSQMTSGTPGSATVGGTPVNATLPPLDGACPTIYRFTRTAGASSAYAWVSQENLILPTGTTQYRASVYSRASAVSVSTSIILDLRWDGITGTNDFVAVAPANVTTWKRIDKTNPVNNATAANYPNPDGLHTIVAWSGGEAVWPVGTVFEYTAPQILEHPGTPGWTIASVPWRPHPFDWYVDGMHWDATNSGTIGWLAFQPGDRIYAHGNPNKPYLFSTELTYSDQPYRIKPEKLITGDSFYTKGSLSGTTAPEGPVPLPWTVSHPSAITVEDNGIRKTDNTTAAAIYVTTNVSDSDVECRIVTMPGNVGAIVGPSHRKDSLDRIEALVSSNGQIILSQRNGVLTQTATGLATVGDMIRLRLQGELASVYLNDVLVIPPTQLDPTVLPLPLKGIRFNSSPDITSRVGDWALRSI